MALTKSMPLRSSPRAPGQGPWPPGTGIAGRPFRHLAHGTGVLCTAHHQPLPVCVYRDCLRHAVDDFIEHAGDRHRHLRTARALLRLTRGRAATARCDGTAVGLVSVIGYTPDVYIAAVAGYLIDQNPGLEGSSTCSCCFWDSPLLAPSRRSHLNATRAPVSDCARQCA